ncbi:MAG TPA: hypothetical protein P5013_01360 [Methanoregula sp.]|nr:hypothetical protein [Methanoregula sp.]
MDLGKIMIGSTRTMPVAGLPVSPSGADVCNRSCTVGCGSTYPPAGAMMPPYSSREGEIPSASMVQVFGNANHESIMTSPPPATRVSFGKMPRTRMNVDHTMHIPVSPHTGM